MLKVLIWRRFPCLGRREDDSVGEWARGDTASTRDADGEPGAANTGPPDGTRTRGEPPEAKVSTGDLGETAALPDDVVSTITESVSTDDDECNDSLGRWALLDAAAASELAFDEFVPSFPRRLRVSLSPFSLPSSTRRRLFTGSDTELSTRLVPKSSISSFEPVLLGFLGFNGPAMLFPIYFADYRLAPLANRQDKA